MLILTRKSSESILIGNDIRVTVVSITGQQVRLGINAPQDVPVHREEIADRIAAEAHNNHLATTRGIPPHQSPGESE